MSPRPTHVAVSRTRRRAVGVVLAVALSAPVVARACPMCKDGAALAQPSATNAPAEAATVDFNTSIYVMLAVVGVVAATAGRAMVKAVRG